MNRNGFTQIPDWLTITPLWIKSSPSLKIVLITCLIKANYEDSFNQKYNLTVKRGSFITHLSTMSNECNIPIRTLRDCLYALSSARFTAQYTAQRYTLITVLDYNDLQKNTFKKWHNYPHELQQYFPHKLCGLEGVSRAVSQGTFIDTIDTDKESLSFLEKNQKPVLMDKEIPSLRTLYPFERRENLKVHLSNRGFIENEIGKILERVYPKEYTGKDG